MRDQIRDCFSEYKKSNCMSLENLLKSKDLDLLFNFVGLGSNRDWIRGGEEDEFTLYLEEDIFHWGFNQHRKFKEAFESFPTEEFDFEFVDLTDGELGDDRIYHPAIVFKVKSKGV